MKAILARNKIVSLEGIKEVEICGSGAKSNPFYIAVYYMNGEHAYLPDMGSDEKKVQAELERILEILTNTP